MRSVKEALGAECPVVFWDDVRRTWEGPSLLMEVEKHRARELRRSARRLMAMTGCSLYQSAQRTAVT